MVDDIESLKGLSPKERIDKLKELEQRRKEEAKLREELLKEARQDLKDELMKEISVPDNDASLRTIDDLEEMVGDEEVPAEVKGVVYKVPLETENKIAELYSQLTELGYTPNWSEEEYEEFYEASDQLNEIRDQFEEKVKKGYQISDNVSSQLVASQNVEYNIRKYREFGR